MQAAGVNPVGASLNVKVAPEVSEALSLGRAVVALESTIISHGFVYLFIYILYFPFHAQCLHLNFFVYNLVFRDAVSPKFGNCKSGWSYCEREWGGSCNYGNFRRRASHRYLSSSFIIHFKHKLLDLYKNDACFHLTTCGFPSHVFLMDIAYDVNTHFYYCSLYSYMLVLDLKWVLAYNYASKWVKNKF